MSSRAHSRQALTTSATNQETRALSSSGRRELGYRGCFKSRIMGMGHHKKNMACLLKRTVKI